MTTKLAWALSALSSLVMVTGLLLDKSRPEDAVVWALFVLAAVVADKMDDLIGALKL